MSVDLSNILAHAWLAGYSISKTYLETLADLPWNRFASRLPDRRPQQSLAMQQRPKGSMSDGSGSSDATVDSAASQADSSAAQQGDPSDQQTKESASSAHPLGQTPGRLQHSPPGAHASNRSTGNYFIVMGVKSDLSSRQGGDATRGVIQSLDWQFFYCHGCEVSPSSDLRPNQVLKRQVVLCGTDMCVCWRGWCRH